MAIWARMQDWFATPPPSGRPLSGALRWAIPNALSLLRIGLAAAFPWAPASWRGGLILGATLSDLFDGRLSRALQGTSTLGQVLDPVADKLFVGSVLVTLVALRELSLGELLLLGFRDLAVISGSAWTMIRHGWRSIGRMPPSWPGKLATAGQFGFLLLLTTGGTSAPPLLRLVEACAMVLSIVAGIDYLRRKGFDAPP